ncbi:hypothetical protein H8356DRAFT_1417091 [Neocallimastix lanati (nom. inval.)]|nr:hypothetical protein H8356DRAFT_1417091 [Neocallimastix sp. JGI-2020a]
MLQKRHFLYDGLLFSDFLNHHRGKNNYTNSLTDQGKRHSDRMKIASYKFRRESQSSSRIYNSKKGKIKPPYLRSNGNIEVEHTFSFYKGRIVPTGIS